MSAKPISIAILASGRGTNAEAIIRYFERIEDVNVALVVTNNPKAGVIDVAGRHTVPVEVIPKFEIQDHLPETLREAKIDFVVLAGFMLLVPSEVIRYYPNRMVNVHPALLPRFGGKGMYGKHVHEAVSNSGETETGITIHFVNEHYDEGQIIQQYKTAITPHEDPDSIRRKVQALEHRYYPQVIGDVVRQELDL